MKEPKRITLFAGHYGSGKTNLAVSYALHIKKLGYPTVIADLDIVNPYFRTKDSAKILETNGIELISPKFANSNVDLPALPQEVYSLFHRRDKYAVLDIGGDDRGAYALGRYAPFIKEENCYDMFFVVSAYRPLTRTAKEALTVMREIEAACHIPFTAIVNNSNIGSITAKEDVLATVSYAEELSRLSGLPIAFTGVCEHLYPQFEDSTLDIFPVKIEERYYDIKN